jgi:hypothetical protein
MKAIGNYSSVRNLFISFLTFSGGLYAEELDFRVVYLTGTIFPALLFFVTLIVFKEPRVIPK